MKRAVLSLSALVLSATLLSADDWSQWGRNSQHTGAVAVAGQPARRMLADVVYDPLVAQEQADPFAEGDLLVHYQTTLLDGDDAFMEFKSGAYTSIDHWETQTWNEKRLHWEHGNLVTKWSFESDWKPASFSPRYPTGPFWEPVFHAVLAGSFLYLPGAGGSIFKLNKTDGSLVARINPLGPGIDLDTYTVGPLSSDGAGNVVYSAVKLAHGNPWGSDVVNSWLIKVSPTGSVQKATYASLLPGAPQGNDKCLGTFSNADLPWPPSPDAVPAKIQCGSQRPGLNAAPAIAADGTIYVVTLAHFSDRNSYLVAVNPDLTPKWAASLRDRFHDGCNVEIPATGTPGGCRAGAHEGVDPRQNRPGAGRVVDDSTSSPVVLPDGGVVYGAYTGYNYSQGELMKFSAAGSFLASYHFGWDVTPAIWSHDGTYSIIIKENHYNTSSYCVDETFCPSDRNANNPAYPEQYFITQLDKDLNVEWRYQNTNQLACTRNPDGSVACVSDHPAGFEWCVNALAVDRNGVVYANSEDGGLYIMNQGGTLKDHIFLELAVGAAYTPLSIDSAGRIYTQNYGHLFVVGR